MALMDRGDIHKLDMPFSLETFERVINEALGRAPHREYPSLHEAGEREDNPQP